MKRLLWASGLAALSLAAPPPAAEAGVTLTVLGTYATGSFDEGAAEIAGYDPRTRRLFVVDGFAETIDVLDITIRARRR